MRHRGLGRVLRYGCGGIVWAVMSSCASAPPAKPITDIQSVAGRWEGRVMTRQGELPGKATINPDGTGVNEVPTGPGRFAMTYKVANGKLHWQSSTTGRTGTCALHEDSTGRMMRCDADDGATSAEWRPAK